MYGGAPSGSSRRTSTLSTTPLVAGAGRLRPAATPGSAAVAVPPPRRLGAPRGPPRAASPPARAVPPGDVGMGGSLTAAPNSAPSPRATPLVQGKTGPFARPSTTIVGASNGSAA